MPVQRFIVVFVLFFLAACNSQTKEGMLQSGIELLEAGNTRGSIVYFKNSLEIDPNFYEARYYLAEAYLRSGRLESAEKEYKKVSLQSSSFADLPLKLSEIYLLTSRGELAIQTLEKFHLDNTPTSESLDLEGRAYALDRDYTRSESLFQKAINLDPENPRLKLHLVKLFLIQSKNEEAYPLLLSLVELHQKFSPGYELLAKLELQREQPALALAAYQRLYELDPTKIDVLYMQGLLHLMLGQLNDAIKIAEKLSAEFPEDYRTGLLRGLIAYRQGSFENATIDLVESLKANRQFLTYYYLGLSYFRLGDLELSISQFQKVLDENPDFLQARLMLAMTFLQQKRIDDCIREVNFVLTKDEHSGVAYNILGSAQLLNNDYDAAMQSFNRAIEIDPGAVDVYLKKSQSLFVRGESELAEATLVEALALSPGVLNARLMLASYYIHQENYAEAVDALQDGLAGVPADALIYNYLAGISFKQKDDQAAIDYLQKAKAANPEYLSPALNLAAYYLSKAEYDKALGEYKAILDQNRNNLTALVGMGVAYELAGQVDLAKQTYEQMLAIESPEAALHVAQYYSKNDRLEEALTVLDEALKKAPLSVPLYAPKASLLLQAGRSNEAMTVLEQLEKLKAGSGYPKLIALLLKQGQDAKAEKIAESVIKGSPGSNYGYLLQSSIFEYKKQPSKAVEVLKQGLSTLPDDARLTLQLGRIHDLGGNTSEAILVYQELINNNPAYYPGFFALGTLYDRRGNKKEAQSYYKKTIALNERYVPALNNLAYLYADNYGDMQMALTLSFKAYRLAPEQQDVMDTLGYVLLKNNKAEEAVKILEKTIKMHGYNPTISFHLALAYVELKQADKAIAELEKSLEGGDFPEAEKCRRLLQKLKA